jgi:hypothetical protein
VVVGSFDSVVVVAGSFDHAWAAAVSPEWVEFGGDVDQDVGQGVVPVFRGKNPRYRWRYGG